MKIREEIAEVLEKAKEKPLDREDALILTKANPIETLELMKTALSIKVKSYGHIVTYSRKVFVPLTNLCRNKCAYCGFRKEPREPGAGYLSIDDALKIVITGEKLGAKEILVSTGEKPEIVYEEARAFLRKHGYTSTVEYVRDFEEKALEKTENMLIHTNIGVLTKKEMAELKPFNASMGLMLETISERLMEKGMPHEKSPTKHPKVRLRMIREAGELKIPFTTGILIGIGETWEERIDSLLEIRKIHSEYGHIQEVIIQNFMPEPKTPMEKHPPPSTYEMVKTIAIARLIFHGEVSVQAPPNLTPQSYQLYLLAGINDWGGVSPLTPDFVNIAYPWPKIREIKRVTEELGFMLRERLAIYPKYILLKQYPKNLEDRILKLVDESGLVKMEYTFY